MTNPRGPEPVDDSFDEQLQPGGAIEQPGHAEESLPADEMKDVRDRLPELTNDELSRLSILDPGVALEQGGVSLDLDDRKRGPFQAIGGHIVQQRDRIIAKRDTDSLLWNELGGDDQDVAIERPG